MRFLSHDNRHIVETNHVTVQMVRGGGYAIVTLDRHDNGDPIQISPTFETEELACQYLARASFAYLQTDSLPPIHCAEVVE